MAGSSPAPNEFTGAAEVTPLADETQGVALPLIKHLVLRQQMSLAADPPDATTSAAGSRWKWGEVAHEGLWGLGMRLMRALQSMLDQGPHKAPAEYPGELAELMVGYMSLKQAHGLSQTNKEHRVLTAAPATAHLLQRAAQSLLRSAQSGQRPDAPRISYVSRAAALIGSPPDSNRRGGSGVLGLPRRLQHEPLAALDLLAQETFVADVTLALRALHAGDELSLVPLLAELADLAQCLTDVQGVLGWPRDQDGLGGSGILALPKEQQVEPLRVLNGCVTFFDDDDEMAQAKLLLTGLTVELGDAQALEQLTRKYRVPPGDEGMAAVRTVWTQACTPPLAGKAGALYYSINLISQFPAEEREPRFAEHLAAWEHLVATNPELFLDRPVETPATPTHAPLAAIGFELDKLLRESVPASFHQEGQRRIQQIEQGIWAARRAAGHA